MTLNIFRFRLGSYMVCITTIATFVSHSLHPRYILQSRLASFYPLLCLSLSLCLCLSPLSLHGKAGRTDSFGQHRIKTTKI
ncbi:hypothetical protein ACRALDRAFT_208645 [Sodiomyces alcalophilus JCM 7366]|uniref:uncharacterized protein n=1 Tax=Sodiomyces alcalophilus JCM 7366 TaxID=591952 RepID=UPI0039B5F225